MPDSSFEEELHTGVIYNRRAYPRTDFGGPVLVDTKTACHKVRAIDVSVGGIRLESDFPLQLGSEVELYFELNSLSVETAARVIRGDGKLFALAFDREESKAGRPRFKSLRAKAA